MKRAAALAVSLAVSSLVSPAALAGPESEVASAFDVGDKFDVHVRVDYRYAARRAVIKREISGAAGADPDGPVPMTRDLTVEASRQELVPRLEIGVFTDVAATLALPIVLSDQRTLRFADGVDRSSSTTIADGLLTSDGFDATVGGGGVLGSGDAIFRGTERSGLDQLEVGGVWAPMNQARDATKPTWKIGAELRLSVGKVMRFDRMDPTGENGTSRGVHEVRLYTSMSRRLGWAEPFFEVWYQAAVGTRKDAPLHALPQRFGAEQQGAQQRAGGRFGFEAIAWESPTRRQRVGLSLAGQVEALFEGRAYSDMWEVFAYAGDARVSGPLRLDADPTVSGEQAFSHPGVSNVENYLVLGGRAGIDAQIAPRVRAGAGFQLAWEQSHLISFADTGVDSGDAGEDVDPGTDEVNPLHAPLIDQNGHRYRVDDGLEWAAILGVRLLF